MILTHLLRITPGKHHAWYATDLGFNVRKPLGQTLGVPLARIVPNSKATVPVYRRVGLFWRLIDWFRNLLGL